MHSKKLTILLRNYSQLCIIHFIYLYQFYVFYINNKNCSPNKEWKYNKPNVEKCSDASFQVNRIVSLI